ncbi:MAG: biotin--[acetyl-CoA-carboxylase] ligase [Proteobacteria bacterium]|nr:biotin--[acetyl-CoA-carboxylase] ligase [Pseudomonadota bacterium]
MSIELLNDTLMRAFFSELTLSRLNQLILLESVDSTNNYLLKMEHPPSMVACFAEQQTAGRGQRGKSWFSPSGQIYFSLLHQVNKPLHQITGLSLAVGIATAEALGAYGIDSSGLQLKWPNDVYYEGKKLAGILVEVNQGILSSCKIVIGIGVNLFSSPNYEHQINQPHTSLEQIQNIKIARNRFAALLVNHCVSSVLEFCQGGFDSFFDLWRKYDYLFGKKIQITQPQNVLTGWMQGISTKGELLLKDDRGQVHHCINGSIQICL